MPRLDRETLLDELNHGGFAIVEEGPLHGPIAGFQISRESDYSLVLETASDSASSSTYAFPPVGTVRSNEDFIVFESLGGTAVAKGVTPRGTKTQLVERGSGDGRSERSHIWRVDWAAKDAPKAQFTIEWLRNCKFHYVWPDMLIGWNRDWSDVSFRAPRHEVGRADKPDVHVGAGYARCCAHLRVNGVDLFIGQMPHGKEDDAGPGFILYDGIVDADLRAKIRDALSFLLGRYIVYLGETHFSAQWKPVACSAVSASTLQGRAFRQVTLPPALLDMEYLHGLNSAVLENAVAAILSQHGRYCLQTVLWNYWHAVSAPLHMAAVDFGAVFERLQEIYFETTAKASRKIVDQAKWSSLSKAMAEVLDSVPLGSQERMLLQNKVSNLNVLPQSMLMERFLQGLGLRITSVETKAWKTGRNRAAHGGFIAPTEHVNVIRENHLFRTLVNRLVLAIAEAADHYIDMYSLEHPVRPLAEGIPEEFNVQGDKKRWSK